MQTETQLKGVLFDLDNTLVHRSRSIARYADRFVADFARRLESVLSSHVARLIDALVSRRPVVGIVSNGAERSRRETVARLSFRRHITTVLSSERAGVKKPDPRVFTRAATELGLANSQSVFVGDHLSMMSKVRWCPECAPSGSKASTAGQTAWPRPSPPHRPWRKSETTSHG